MTDFKIRRGLSTDLFQEGKLNSQVILELGCWYLCIDTAELFLCTSVNDRILKRINSPSRVLIDVDIDNGTSLILRYSDGSLETIALDRAIVDIITGAGYVTADYVKDEILKAQLAGTDIDLSDYATKEYVANLLNEYPKSIEVVATCADLPEQGDPLVTYRVVDEKTLYQYNAVSGCYEAISSASGNIENIILINGGKA